MICHILASSSHLSFSKIVTETIVIKMGKTFQKIHACLAGKLQHGDKVAQWVRSNGGEFHKEVTSKVTHLIASTEAYKANVEAGKDRTFFFTPKNLQLPA